jgi:hypothetical protein
LSDSVRIASTSYTGPSLQLPDLQIQQEQVQRATPSAGRTCVVVHGLPLPPALLQLLQLLLLTQLTLVLVIIPAAAAAAAAATQWFSRVEEYVEGTDSGARGAAASSTWCRPGAAAAAAQRVSDVVGYIQGTQSGAQVQLILDVVQAWCIMQQRQR